jgi:hypothetical protein
MFMRWEVGNCRYFKGGTRKLALLFVQCVTRVGGWVTPNLTLLFWTILLKHIKLKIYFFGGECWFKSIVLNWGRHGLNISFLTFITFLSIKPLKIGRLFLTFPPLFRVKRVHRGGNQNLERNTPRKHLRYNARYYNWDSSTIVAQHIFGVWWQQKHTWGPWVKIVILSMVAWETIFNLSSFAFRQVVFYTASQDYWLHVASITMNVQVYAFLSPIFLPKRKNQREKKKVTLF